MIRVCWFYAVFMAVLLGCSLDQPAGDLRPLVAAGGAYGLMDQRQPQPQPGPQPGPTACVRGCKCNGTGREPTGDGLATVECRCPDNCPCKAKK